MHIQSKIANSQAQSNSVDTLLVSTQELFVNVHMVNALLGKLKCGKENSLNHVFELRPTVCPRDPVLPRRHGPRR